MEAKLFSRNWSLYAAHPKTIITMWSDVERYFKKYWLIGYIGYEQGYRFMQPPPGSVLRKKKSDSLKLPDVYFGVFEHLSPSPPLLNRRGARGEVQQIDMQSNLSYRHYLSIIRRTKQHIRQGDIYQANISQRLQGKYDGSAAELFYYFVRQQPVPYSAMITTPDFSVVSNSPELFLKIQQGVMETRPIKGTRPRGQTTTKDKALRRELLASEKDQAELDMIIDVHRNDCNRVAKTGSVRVLRHRHLLPYRTVWQAEATIQAQLAAGCSTLDAIAVCFPAGSVTGAPKIRAMEIIHELEPHRRNVYTGAIGYIDPHGNCEFNVAIRTAILQRQQLYYTIGGGITFDSNPAAEYQETLDKAKIILNH